MKPVSGYKTVSEEEFLEIRREFAGYDYPDLEPGEAPVIWDPRVKAKTTPEPRSLNHLVPPGPLLPASTGSAAEAMQRWDFLRRDPSVSGKRWFVFGAGESPLHMDLTPLNGEIVLGINYTMRWFAPSIIQIIDRDPYEAELLENLAWWHGLKDRVLLSTSAHAIMHRTAPIVGRAALGFNIDMAAHKEFENGLHWASEPKDPMTHYNNSIGWAIQSATWCKPSAIFLLGFDWGGYHFTGDGRAVGSRCWYGTEEDERVCAKLRWLRDRCEEEGFHVYHVGPSKLEVWKEIGNWFETLEEAFDAHEVRTGG